MDHRYYREAASGPPAQNDRDYRRWTAVNDNNHNYNSYRPDYGHDDRRDDRRDDRHYNSDNHRSDYARDREYQYDLALTAGRAYDREHGFAPGVDPERYLRPPPPPSTLPPPPPSLPSNPAPGREGGDSYRPKLSFEMPRADFDFRVKAPSAIKKELDRQAQDEPAFQGYSHEDARGEKHRRRDARRDGRETQEEQKEQKLRLKERRRLEREERRRRERQEKRGQRDQPYQYQPSRSFRPPKPRPLLAERELLSGAHADTPTELFYDESAGATYRNLSDISDSDAGEDMDISDSGSNSGSEAEEPRHKRARKGDESASGADVPKWSNPDPYTACPPETGQQTKKKDVVQLIRKARVQAKEVKSSLPEEPKDFISLDIDSTDESESEYEPEPEPAPGARDLEQAADKISGAFAAQFGQPLLDEPKTTIKRSGPTPTVVDGPFPPQPEPSRTGEFGSRKRFHDDRIKGAAPSRPSKKSGPRPNGDVTEEWAPRPGVDPTPWFDQNAWQPNAMIA